MLVVASTATAASDRSYVPTERTYTSLPSATLDAVPQRLEGGEDRAVARVVARRVHRRRTPSCVESSNTRTTTESVAVVPSVPVTVRSNAIVDTSSGAVNDGDGPPSVPAPPVTSGPDALGPDDRRVGRTRGHADGGELHRRSRSSATSTPALATAGTAAVVGVSGTVVDVVEVVVDVVVEVEAWSTWPPPPRWRRGRPRTRPSRRAARRLPRCSVRS